jgi:hypothetical protein
VKVRPGSSHGYQTPSSTTPRPSKGDKRLKAIKVRLCDWLFRAIQRDRRVLDYDPPISSSVQSNGGFMKSRSACGHGPIEVELEELRLQTAIKAHSSIFVTK